MIEYILCFCIVMFFGLISGASKRKNEKYVLVFLILFTIIYGLLAGMRSDSVGWDTKNYHSIFSYCSDTWESLFDAHYNNRWMEPGIVFVGSLIKILGGDYHVFLTFISFFIMGAYATFVYRHSENPLFSVFLAISFPFFYTSMDIVRTYIAISFFLLGYKYVEEKKFIKFLCIMMIGSLFHKISILFILIYFIEKIRWNKVSISISIIVTFLTSYFIDDIALFVSGLIRKGVAEGWVGTYAGGLKTCLMYFVLFLVGLSTFTKLKDKKGNYNYLSYMLLLFLASVLFINARMAIRLMVAFVPLMSIALPNMISRLRKSNVDTRQSQSVYVMTVTELLVIGIGIFYHAYMLIINWQNVVPYVPFWR